MTAHHPDRLLHAHRAELLGYCYRMLGSPFDADDAVQETMLRAWRGFAGFDERRGSLRSWLYAIATNVCLDLLRSGQRRARAMDLGPASRPGGSLGTPLPETAWVQPVPDSALAAGDPGEVALARESIRLAFVAALQQLPPRQRAVLILRDVLSWRADEVAGLLDTTVSSVNSALQRARATIRARHRTPRPAELTAVQRQLLDRYVDAFERHDVDTLVSLLREDAVMAMPPFGWWLRGRSDIAQALRAPGNPCQAARLVATTANGSPAFGQYRPTGDGGYEAFALVVVEILDTRITEITTYLDPARLFPLFDLSARLPDADTRPADR